MKGNMVHKNGSRLQSQVDETQVIVVRAGQSLSDLRCGGAQMVALDARPNHVGIDPEFAVGTVLGKRYVATDGAELLVTKPGQGTLSIGVVPLVVKEAAPLPASD